MAWREFGREAHRVMLINTLDRTRRRTIVSNWSGYLPDPNRPRNFEASDPDIIARATPPDNWDGRYDFKHANTRSPLHSFVADSTDARNTALWGMRLASNPGTWVNWKARGVNQDVVEDIIRAGGSRIARWRLLWDDADLILAIGRSSVRRTIRQRVAGPARDYVFTMRLPASHSYTLSGGVMRIRDSSGVVRLNTAAPGAVDANGDAVGVQLIDDGPVGNLRRFIWRVADTTGATAPIDID